jgi:hypothetical protein
MPRTAFILGLVCLVAASASADQEPAPTGSFRPEVVRREVARLVADLDSDRFAVRRKASARLGAMIARPELGALLAEEFDRVLVRPNVSFEVRSRLERLRERLPPTPPKPTETITAAGLDRLVRQLDDASYSVRLGAARRLERMLADEKQVCPILVRLKRRLAQVDRTPDARRWLEPLYERARAAWLLNDPSGDDLPEVSRDEIARWIDTLARPVPADARAGAWHGHRLAARELADLLARENYLAQVKALLEARLGDENLDPLAAGRLQKLLDWTRPAMVAEYWTDRHNTNRQHLLVGVPSQSQGAPRPSHFDRIDDRRAHCVSGSNLLPGDYPVGVAFVHPNIPDAFFVLRNLPTPRRRMAYAHVVQTDPSARLAALSRRTLDAVLAEKRELGERELAMLAQLDPKEVSRFAGKYFALVEDAPLGPVGRNHIGGRPSRGGMICTQLALDGTRDARAGVLEAIDRGRFLPPTPLAPYRLEWIAVLSIARRDPWPDVDQWLVGLLERTEPLREGRRDAPTLGASAAALLLLRHGRTPAEFGLAPAEDRLLSELHVTGHRFTSPEAPKRVHQWWQREK